MGKKKNVVEGLLLIGDFSIPATVTVDVELDVSGAGLIDVLFSQSEDAPEPDQSDVPEEDTAETIVVDETAATAAPVASVSRVDAVRRAIRGVREIGEHNAPMGVVSQFPAGYTYRQADEARTRILRVVEANLSEQAINQFAGDLNGFLHHVNATYGGDKVVAEFIHGRLVEAAHS